VVAGLDRRSLVNLRRQIAETAILAEDREVGRQEARRALGSAGGRIAMDLAGRVRHLACDLRDRRGAIMGARELDGIMPRYAFS
jgi:hypothetical protein